MIHRKKSFNKRNIVAPDLLWSRSVASRKMICPWIVAKEEGLEMSYRILIPEDAEYMLLHTGIVGVELYRLEGGELLDKIPIYYYSIGGIPFWELASVLPYPFLEKLRHPEIGITKKGWYSKTGACYLGVEASAAVSDKDVYDLSPTDILYHGKSLEGMHGKIRAKHLCHILQGGAKCLCLRT